MREISEGIDVGVFSGVAELRFLPPTIAPEAYHREPAQLSSNIHGILTSMTVLCPRRRCLMPDRCVQTIRLPGESHHQILSRPITHAEGLEYGARRLDDVNALEGACRHTSPCSALGTTNHLPATSFG